MPKDEFDFDDPMELNGMAFATDEDTTDAMCECFIEEFMRMGFDAPRILALFRNPHYIGMNMVMENRGEIYVKEFIAEVFARWGRHVSWSGEHGSASAASTQTVPLDLTACDPMGAALPKLNY